MKKIFALSILFMFLGSAFAQLPAVTLKDLEGNSVDLSKLSNNGKPIVISFWATWCKPCRQELTAMQELYAKWQKETGVKVIAVSIDDARTTAKVEPVVNAEGWDFDVLLDPNGALKRAMNVNQVPHTFLLDGKGKIVWQHNNYTAGDENTLYKEILKLVGK